MLKYKYVIDNGNFSNIEAFQAYLNRMGKKGYELVQWQLVNTSFMALNSIIQPVGNTLSIFITWKIEDHDS
jgi:hypothetical protein